MSLFALTEHRAKRSSPLGKCHPRIFDLENLSKFSAQDISLSVYTNRNPHRADFLFDRQW